MGIGSSFGRGASDWILVWPRRKEQPILDRLHPVHG